MFEIIYTHGDNTSAQQGNDPVQLLDEWWDLEDLPSDVITALTSRADFSSLKLGDDEFGVVLRRLPE